jgi:hypothetical protein
MRCRMKVEHFSYAPHPKDFSLPNWRFAFSIGPQWVIWPRCGRCWTWTPATLCRMNLSRRMCLSHSAPWGIHRS